MKPPTPHARRLFAALTALAERGINGELDNARDKLERLKSRFDFSQPDPEGPDLFAGVFIKRPGYTVPVCIVPDQEIAGFVKWAVEGRTGISCWFKGSEMLVEATDGTARTLHGITATVADAFARLWETFTRAGGLSGDRRVFMRGLFDGMMNEDRAPGQALPQRTQSRIKPKPEDMICKLPEELQHFAKFNRAVVKKCDEENGRVQWIRYYYEGKKIAESAPDLNQGKLHEAFYKLQGKRARALVRAPGIEGHPYTIAVDLGKKIRLTVPVATVDRELANTLKKQIQETKL